MKFFLKLPALAIVAFSTILISSCASSNGLAEHKPRNMGPKPDPAVRAAQIAAEPRGDFFYGRRYFVYKTKFWGYLRKPGQPWETAKLVIMDERSINTPDRLPEGGPSGARYSFDQNYEYRISGNYTGEKVYDPNSNSFYPGFAPTSFSLIDKKPGWIFTPSDYYDPLIISLRPR